MIHRVPRIERTDDEPRQDVPASPGMEFARACPEHREILTGETGEYCPAGHTLPLDSAIGEKTDEITRTWLIVEVVDGHAARTAGRVIGGNVEWASWFLDSHPTVVRLHRRTAGGFASRFTVAERVGYHLRGAKQAAYRLRQRGMSREEAMAEAERRALARLAVEFDRRMGAERMSA